MHVAAQQHHQYGYRNLLSASAVQNQGRHGHTLNLRGKKYLQKFVPVYAPVDLALTAHYLATPLKHAVLYHLS